MAKKDISQKTIRRPVLMHRRVTRRVKLAVVPHAANEYRPHLVRAGGIVAVLLLVIGLHLGYNLSRTGSVLGVEANVTSEQLLDSTNDQRQQNNVEPLRYSEQLSAAAYMKARDMFAQQYWAHTAPDGTTPWQWFAKADYNYAYAGENLAKNFSSAGAVVSAWMTSPEHRKNMLDTHYQEIGFAVVDGVLGGKQTKLIVALFGAPAGAVGVAGATEQGAAPVGGLNLVTRFGVALQSVTPAALGSVILLLFAALVALVAHGYRKRLPPSIRRSWRYHHGLYKGIGLTAIAVVIVALYSGGQI